MRVYQEEIFGPVVAAVPFEDVDDDLVRRANDTIYGLAAVCSREIGAPTASGAACARAGVDQRRNIFDAPMPFGGYKQSGWGREMGTQCSITISNKSVCAAVTWCRGGPFTRSTAGFCCGTGLRSSKRDCVIFGRANGP
jgi:phenylacetaldehyde dehydrogenase